MWESTSCCSSSADMMAGILHTFYFCILDFLPLVLFDKMCFPWKLPQFVPPTVSLFQAWKMLAWRSFITSQGPLQREPATASSLFTVQVFELWALLGLMSNTGGCFGEFSSISEWEKHGLFFFKVAEIKQTEQTHTKWVFKKNLEHNLSP